MLALGGHGGIIVARGYGVQSPEAEHDGHRDEDHRQAAQRESALFSVRAATSGALSGTGSGRTGSGAGAGFVGYLVGRFFRIHISHIRNTSTQN